MADNFAATEGSGTVIAAHEVTYSGDTTKLQIVSPVYVSGSEGAKTVNEVFFNSTPAVSGYGQTVRQPVVSTAHLITAATTNATSVKASAGTLKSVHIFNNRASPLYVKFHNTSSAPTPGSGVVLTVGVQAGTQRDVVLTSGGRAFTTGIGMSVVAGLADADATAVAASDAAIEVCYE